MSAVAKKKRQRDPPIDVYQRPYSNFIGPVGTPLELRIMADKARCDRKIAANPSSETDAGDEVHRPGESEAGE